jgi:hypothetical protein
MALALNWTGFQGISEGTIMETALEEAVGICSTCNSLPDCRHRLVNHGPIWFCEQFDDYTAPKPMDPHPTQFAVQTNERAGYLGLCSNCENLPQCSYPKLDGGIWHCEEYL